jgi:cytochrome c-type biogenesis protein CcmE
MLLALSVAALLSGFMVYTALAGSDVAEPVIEMRELADRQSEAQRETVELVGVASGPVKGDKGREISFFMADMKNEKTKVLVRYKGTVPDSFRVGRNVIVKGKLAKDGEFIGKPGSLVTKCPSKFETSGGSGRSSG